MSNYNINLHEAIYSLSDALDLVGVTHIHHGKRVAYMAAECAKQMGWTGANLDDLFQAAILHDCGVSKTSVHAKLAQFEWEEERDHCHLGADLLRSSSLLHALADQVLHHHTPWDELKNLDVSTTTKLSANCIFMVDRVDILSLQYCLDSADILLGKEMIRQKIQASSGHKFCPELVDAFMRVSNSEAFWFSLESDHVNGYAATWLAQTTQRGMSFEELRGLVRIFSQIVDAKSPFTKQHSDGVADLARYLGQRFDLDRAACEMLELAGLLHDIGKLRVPDELLEKPGALTEAESIAMRRHSFDTFSILKNIKGLEQVTLWAAQHHERVDGSGYPYHTQDGGISLEARIIAVADVFQALAQRRPYRDSLNVNQIMDILRQQVQSGKLDPDVVKCVDDNLHECWEASQRVLPLHDS